MAFLDFLNQGVGGMTSPQTTPGLAGEGDVVTAQPKPIGPTWGDLTRAAMTYGSTNPTTRSIGSLIPVSNQTTQPLQPLLPSKNNLQTVPQKNQQNQTNLDSILKILGGLFGGA